jgi:GNAT superfamily N-acetyltransferase
MQQQTIIRPAEAADAAAIAALIGAAFAAQPVPLDPPPSALGETAETIARQLASGGGAVAVGEGRLIGAVMWAEEAGTLHVARLSVAPEARRHGIARALLAAAEAAARVRGLGRLTLGTRLALVGNRALFAVCGYVETVLHTHPGYDAPTWVEMEKRL